MSIITGKSTTKYKGDDTTISVRFRNKTPIEYFIFDGVFGSTVQPEFIDDNDFDDFIDRAYQDACKSEPTEIKSMNNLIEIQSASDLTDEQITRIKTHLNEWGGDIHTAGKAIGIQFPEHNENNIGIIIDILFRIFGRLNRDVFITKEDYYLTPEYAIEIAESDHYWITAFYSEEDAIRFCEKHNLTIIEK